MPPRPRDNLALVLNRLLAAFRGLFRPAPKGATFTAAPPSPGQTGTNATTEIDPTRIRQVVMRYAPRPNGDADPGEVVWTWVPFEERDGRGKDRPVLVVASEPGDTVLVVQLTSQDRAGWPGYVPIGVGGWDVQRRPSYVNLERVFRVHQGGMRREASALDGRRFDLVRSELVARYGWRSA